MAVAMTLGVGLAADCSSGSRPAASSVVTASAASGVDHASLVVLAGSLVGGTDKLADPGAGRLPDVAAFRAAGIDTVTVSGSTIRVVFLANASSDQRQAAERALRSSPA